jgi:hypothetical protein
MRSQFQVGMHIVSVFGLEGRCVVSVDGILLRGHFDTTADAWAAGVAEVERLDRGPLPDPPVGVRLIPAGSFDAARE